MKIRRIVPVGPGSEGFKNPGILPDPTGDPGRIQGLLVMEELSRSEKGRGSDPKAIPNGYLGLLVMEELSRSGERNADQIEPREKKGWSCWH